LELTNKVREYIPEELHQDFFTNFEFAAKYNNYQEWYASLIEWENEWNPVNIEYRNRTARMSNPAWFASYTDDMHALAKSVFTYYAFSKEVNYSLSIGDKLIHRVLLQDGYKLSKKNWRRFIENHKIAEKYLDAMSVVPKFETGDHVTVKMVGTMFLVKTKDMQLLNYRHKPVIDTRIIGTDFSYVKSSLSVSTHPKSGTVIAPLTLVRYPVSNNRYYYIELETWSVPIAIEETYLLP
jgi:hypothetical protein